MNINSIRPVDFYKLLSNIVQTDSIFEGHAVKCGIDETHCCITIFDVRKESELSITNAFTKRIIPGMRYSSGNLIGDDYSFDYKDGNLSVDITHLYTIIH